MSNAFDQARAVERRSRNIIEPLLEQSTDGRFVYTDKGRLAREFQKKYGDVLINEKNSQELFSVEMKAEQKTSPNLFLEVWSNGSRYTLGWMFHCEADLLFYHFIDSDDLYIVKFQNLKRWFWFGIGPVRKSGKAMIHTPGFLRFNPKQQRSYIQKNDTWGSCVPISVISGEVGIKKFNPLGLFGMEKAA